MRIHLTVTPLTYTHFTPHLYPRTPLPTHPLTHTHPHPHTPSHTLLHTPLHTGHSFFSFDTNQGDEDSLFSNPFGGGFDGGFGGFHGFHSEAAYSQQGHSYTPVHEWW